MMYRIAHYSFLFLLRGVLSSCVVCRYRISISQWKYTNLHPCLSLCCVLSLLSPSIDLLCLGYDIWYCAIVYESLPLITKLSVLLTGPLSTSSHVRIMPIALRVVTKVLSYSYYADSVESCHQSSFSPQLSIYLLPDAEHCLASFIHKRPNQRYLTFSI